MLVSTHIIIGKEAERLLSMPDIMSPTATEAEGRFFAVSEALAEPSRRDIVADIVAHPMGLPSIKELTFTTGLHRTTVREHLAELIEAGIVEEVEFSPGERQRGRPSKFYGITGDAREIFDRNGVFLEEHWQELYEQVDKPPEIEAAQEAPRPSR